jgi:hypothetical protein
MGAEAMTRMMKHLAVATVLAFTATSAAAQTTLPFRGYISVDGTRQGASDDFQDSAVFTEHAEEGRFETDYSVSGGPAFNISGGALLWRQIGVGVGVSRFSRSTPVVFNGQVPHPFVFDQDRAVTGDIGGLKREELAVNIRATAVFPLGSRTQVMVFGGPSFFRVTQGIVTDFSFTEQYPYDTASFASGETREAKESKMGANVGVDVGYFFTPQIGIGGIVQFAGVTLDFPSAGGGTQEVKTGGFQAGGGLRLRFWR